VTVSATWGEDNIMDFQLWVRELLSDAASRNKAQVVAELAPHTLRTLYDQGVPPTVEGLTIKTASEQSPR